HACDGFSGSGHRLAPTHGEQFVPEIKRLTGYGQHRPQETRLKSVHDSSTILQVRHQRNSAEPQVKPPPMASSSTKSPFLTRPSPTATDNARGMEAAEVLPCRSTV